MAVFLLILSLGLLDAQNKRGSPNTLLFWNPLVSVPCDSLNVTGVHSVPDSMFAYNDSLRMIKRPWRATVQNVGLNAAVWAFDLYAINEDFARISFRSIRRNIANGLVWDNDKFSTNLLAHPYIGGIYFNTARSNGLSFWESVPYSFGGSLMWEMLAEVEPPAINDFVSTSIGGIALGEVTHRVSSLILDDSKRGVNRFFRELTGTLVSPARGLNRILTGDAWKVRHKYYSYHDFNQFPVKFSATIGNRFMSDDNYLFKKSNVPYLEFDLIYGHPLQETTNQPFDYFNLNAIFNLDGSQPVVGSVNLAAKLYGKYMEPIPGHKMCLGIFQHFDYFDSKLVTDGSRRIPFKISEAVAFGVGLLYQFPTINNVSIRQNSYLNAILLGGSLTDYYFVINRNYNMGSGYSIKSNTNIEFDKYGYFELNLMDYRIYTWKGYETKDYKNINPLYLNSQGDKSKVRLTVINPSMGLNLSSKTSVSISLYYYLRNMDYVYHKDIFYYTFEARLGLRCNF